MKLILLLSMFICNFSNAAEVFNISVKTLGESYSGSPTPKDIPATLFLPQGSGLPAVIIVHGSAGPDTRGQFHRQYLVENGYAVLELDMWKPRGVDSFSKRPRSTLDTLPDVWGALSYLSRHHRIDSSRVAIMGFSWGGVNAFSVAFGKKPKNSPTDLDLFRFAAHIAFYPICDIWIPGGIASRVIDFGRPGSAPVQIHNGTRDDYDTRPDVCESLPAAHPSMKIEVVMYEGVGHGFDSLATAPVIFNDPIAKNGRGGRVTLVGNAAARNLARSRVLIFLETYLK